MLTLKAEARDKSTKLDKIRKTGKIPAILYGKKEASTPISISKKDFSKVWGEAGESTVVTLETPDGEKESLIHDIDIDPITGEPRHADFYVFEKGHKVTVELPIEFEGVSQAVKEHGGVFVKVLYGIKVEAMPKDLPSHIIIDISVFKNIGDQILAQDLRLPEGVTLIENPEEVVALVAEPKEEVEEESTPIDLTSIEVEKKGKEEGENEETESEDKSEDKTEE